MAQSVDQPESPGKRPLELSEVSAGQPTKKIRRAYHHHHQLRHEYQGGIPGSEPTFLDDAQIDQLLKRAIATQCQGYGFETIEQAALESFRDVVEEYIQNFTSLVRQSMLACRRTQPLYVDFEWAFARTKVPEKWREGELPFEELEHDLKLPFRPNSPPLLLTPPPDEDAPSALDKLDPENTTPDRMKGFVPATFPALPAAHSYKRTEVYTSREDDPRRIRELATEEGRMGEQALRKLAGATRMETKVDLHNKNKQAAKAKLGWGGKKVVSAESMFEKTMQRLMRKEMEDKPEISERGQEVKFELGPIVNWERKFWMQPNASGRSRGLTGGQPNGSTSKGKEVSKADQMDFS